MSYFGARTRMTRLMLEKIENDNFLKQIDQSQWYYISDMDQILEFKDKFVQFNQDSETSEFLEKCFEKSESLLTQLFHSFMLSFLKFFMAITSINGLLQRGSMFVFSTQQFKTLIDYEKTYGGLKLNNLLDLGAGDGAVTSKMAPFFENVYATEMSIPMQWRLRQKGFKIVNVHAWDTIKKEPFNNSFENKNDEDIYLKFDAIACLNLLDRCDRPISILRKIKNSLVKDGILIIALVLPFKPYVEYNEDHKPKENLLNFTLQNNSVFNQLKSSNNDFCENITCKKINKVNYQINYLVKNVFEPIGFELLKFTRLPYLCEGNLAQSYYFMNDYVFIFRSIE